MVKKIIIAALAMALLPALAACAGTDVVGAGSVNSFQEVLTAMDRNVSEDEMNRGWALVSPDGTERFLWSRDYSSENPHDIMLEFDAKPFLDAGLDPNKLAPGMLVEDKIMVGSDLGGDKYNGKGDVTPLASYEMLVELYRDRVKYHADLDHYGVSVGNGNMFEWAKDMSTNDKDIVFVVDPTQLVDAGVDPEKVEGWVFTKVKGMDENGKPIEADKFLKPFSIQ